MVAKISVPYNFESMLKVGTTESPANEKLLASVKTLRATSVQADMAGKCQTYHALRL